MAVLGKRRALMKLGKFYNRSSRDAFYERITPRSPGIDGYVLARHAGCEAPSRWLSESCQVAGTKDNASVHIQPAECALIAALTGLLNLGGVYARGRNIRRGAGLAGRLGGVVCSAPVSGNASRRQEKARSGRGCGFGKSSCAGGTDESQVAGFGAKQCSELGFRRGCMRRIGSGRYMRRIGGGRTQSRSRGRNGAFLLRCTFFQSGDRPWRTWRVKRRRGAGHSALHHHSHRGSRPLHRLI